MNMHKNARQMPCGRERMVLQVQSGKRRKALLEPQVSAGGLGKAVLLPREEWEKVPRQGG